MTELQEAKHPAHCPCDDCWSVDVTNIILAHPKSSWWNPETLAWVRHLRRRDLNWSLEPGHCALCGGTSLNCWATSEHWMVKGHNPQTVGDTTYLSLLVHKDGAWQATYSGVSKKGKLALREWASHVLGIKPQFACAVAVRELQDWTEIRVGFRYAD